MPPLFRSRILKAALAWGRRTAHRSWRPSGARLNVERLEDRRLCAADVLLVGDQSDDTVKQFDAATGEYLGQLVLPGSGGLHGPRGLLFRDPSELLLVNQNVFQPVNGEVFRFDAQDGDFLGALVSASDANSPFAPRGMVLKDEILYVADVTATGFSDGRILRYDAATGAFLDALAPPPGLAGFSGLFNPRGLVFGLDDQLYVSVFDIHNPPAGHILRVDPSTASFSVFAANDGDGVDEPGETPRLHAPEGLTFGPDGRLYSTSFTPFSEDGHIVVFDAAGQMVDQIDLAAGGAADSHAQALLFGPDGKLFVPITGSGADSGSVRRYDVTAKTFEVFVPPLGTPPQIGPLGQPWFLTFGQTDPATLAYGAVAQNNLTLSPSSIAENTNTRGSDVAIGAFSVTGPGGPFAFSLTAGAGDDDNGAFVIVGDQLRVKRGEALNFEAKPTYRIRVRATDGTNTFEKALTVQVTNVNEPPTDITLSPSSILENVDTSAGDVFVGMVSAADPDAGDTLTFSLAAGAGDADNTAFRIRADGVLFVRQGTVVDFDVQSSYQVRVEVSDGVHVFAKPLVVSVTQVDRDPADTDGNGVVSLGDLFPVIEHLRTRLAVPNLPYDANLDVNRDTSISIADVLAIVQALRNRMGSAQGEAEPATREEPPRLDASPSVYAALDLLTGEPDEDESLWDNAFLADLAERQTRHDADF